MIKQAYVRGLAARGILRARMLQKQAADFNPEPVSTTMYDSPVGPKQGPYTRRFIESFMDPYKSSDPVINAVFSAKPKGKSGLSRGATDALSGLGGAGIGAIIGALIAYARKKKVLGHALAGAGIGGLAGVGGSELYRYLNNKGGTTQDDLPLLAPDIADSNELTNSELRNAVEYSKPGILPASVLPDSPIA